MDDVVGAIEPEVVDEAAVKAERLRPNAGLCLGQMPDPNGWDKLLECRDECTLRDVTPQLAERGAPMTAGEEAEPWVRDDFPQVGEIEVSGSVTLAREREDSVRPDPHTARDLFREMDAEEGE
jgi:hypothetical protein